VKSVKKESRDCAEGEWRLAKDGMVRKNRELTAGCRVNDERQDTSDERYVWRNSRGEDRNSRGEESAGCLIAIPFSSGSSALLVDFSLRAVVLRRFTPWRLKIDISRLVVMT